MGNSSWLVCKLNPWALIGWTRCSWLSIVERTLRSLERLRSDLGDDAGREMAGTLIREDIGRNWGNLNSRS